MSSPEVALPGPAPSKSAGFLAAGILLVVVGAVVAAFGYVNPDVNVFSGDVKNSPWLVAGLIAAGVGGLLLATGVYFFASNFDRQFEADWLADAHDRNAD